MTKAPTTNELMIAEYMAEEELQGLVRQACNESGLDRPEIAKRLNMGAHRLARYLNHPNCRLTVKQAANILRAIGQRLIFTTQAIDKPPGWDAAMAEPYPFVRLIPGSIDITAIKPEDEIWVKLKVKEIWGTNMTGTWVKAYVSNWEVLNFSAKDIVYHIPAPEPVIVEEPLAVGDWAEGWRGSTMIGGYPIAVIDTGRAYWRDKHGVLNGGVLLQHLKRVKT